YKALQNEKSIQLVTDMSKEQMEEALQKGRIATILKINSSTGSETDNLPHYNLQLYTSGASAEKMDLLKPILRDVIHHLDTRLLPEKSSVASIQTIRMPGRVYKQIDFILPG